MQTARIRTPSQCHRREPSGIIAFTYDASGNLKTFTQPLAATSTTPASTQTGYLNTYNANGAFTAGTSTTGQAVTHTYTPRGKPATQTIAGQTTTYLYDAIGQDKKVTYPNGDRLDYTYSAAHQLTRITWNGSEIYPTYVLPLNPLAASNKITHYAGNVAQMLGMSEGGAGINPFGKTPASSVSQSSAARGLPAAGAATGVSLGGLGAGVGIGAGFGVAAALSEKFRIDNDGYIRSEQNERVCKDGRDPDECKKLYDKVEEGRRQTDTLGGCKGNESGALRFAKTFAWRGYWISKETFKIRCMPNDDNHRAAINNAKAAYEKCRTLP